MTIVRQESGKSLYAAYDNHPKGPRSKVAPQPEPEDGSGLIDLPALPGL